MIDAVTRPALATESPPYRPHAGRPAVFHLAFFGGATVAGVGGPITGRATQRHRIALLALLSSTKRRSRNREQLITLLWPDTDADRGRRLLSDSIYRVNRALGGDAIIGAGDDLRLNRERMTSDVAAFEQAVELQNWHRAAALYAGPFLDGFFLPGSVDFDHWMDAERTQHARAAAKAIDALATDAHNTGRMTDAVELWLRLTELNPEDSRVAMKLMRALDAAGNRAGALRHFQRHAEFLSTTLGVTVDRSLQNLAQHIASRCDAVDDTVDAPLGTSIAVLPFADLSAVDAYAGLADGISQEVTFLLTRHPGFRVASRTSCLACRELKLDAREVAARLNVDWILEGSLRRSGDRLRVLVQLANARRGYHVWSDSFDWIAPDVFEIQTVIASTIAERLAATITAGKAPGDRVPVYRPADGDRGCRS